MTDARKYIEEKFDQFFEFDTDDRSAVTSASCRFFAEHCIEQLMAVIAKKDDALIKACELIEKFSLHVYNGSDCLMVYEAVELQPSDVELSDIGYISEDGAEVFLTKGLQIDAETCGVPVTKLYTIKTKADKK